MKTILSFIFIFFISFIGISQDAEYILEDNIPYYSANINEYQQQMSVVDIYYPKTEEKVPVVIWFHGGGLTSGSKQIPQALKNKGLCVVGVGYRLSPKVKAETSVKDAAAAVAWVYRNIEKYNGDPDKIFVSGHSAGGYLALMTVMNKALLAEHDLDPDIFAGLIPFSGHTITHLTIRKENGIPEKQPVIDEWAPLYYVRKDTPPILLITGDREKEMLGRYEENAYFYRMMKVAGQDDISLLELDGYGHLMSYPGFPLLVDFVKERTKN